jgi:hypothetical protein
LEAHLERLPESYFNRFSADEVFAHAKGVSGLTPESPVHLRVRENSETGGVECTVLAFDTPGVFSLITGLLAATGFSIESGDIFTYERAAAAPDPYNALARFEHLVEEIVKLPDRGEWSASLSDPHLMRDLSRILGASDYLWEDFIRTQYESLLPCWRATAARPGFAKAKRLSKSDCAIRWAPTRRRVGVTIISVSLPSVNSAAAS